MNQLTLFDERGHQLGDAFAHHRNPKYVMRIVEIHSDYVRLLCPDGNYCYLYKSLIDTMLKIDDPDRQKNNALRATVER